MTVTKVSDNNYKGCPGCDMAEAYIGIRKIFLTLNAIDMLCSVYFNLYFMY